MAYNYSRESAQRMTTTDVDQIASQLARTSAVPFCHTRFMRARNAAELVKRNKLQVLRAAKSGELKGDRVGARNEWRFSPSEVRVWARRAPKRPGPEKRHTCVRGSEDLHPWRYRENIRAA